MNRKVPKTDWMSKKLRKALTGSERKKMMRQVRMEEDEIEAEIRRRIAASRPKGEKNAGRLGYRLYCDLSSGWQKSVRGYRHLFVAVDGGGQYSWQTPLKTKTDVRGALKQIRDEMTELAEECKEETKPEMLNGRARIRHIEVDGDGMFRSKTKEAIKNMSSEEQSRIEEATKKRQRGFFDWCKSELGTVSGCNTAAHSHESAGVAEAGVQIAQLQTNKVLLDSPVSLRYW